MQPVGALSQVLLGNREKSYQIWCQHELPIKTNSETIQGPKRPSSTRRSAVCSCTQVLGWTQGSSIDKSFKSFSNRLRKYVSTKFSQKVCAASGTVQATSQHWIFTKGYNETTWPSSLQPTMKRPSN